MWQGIKTQEAQHLAQFHNKYKEAATMTTPKGMIVSIFIDQRIGESSNHGISSKCKEVTLIDDDIPEMYEPTEKAPAVKLVRRTIRGSEYIHAEPVNRPDPGCVGWMMGGSYIHCSDSRIRDINQYPIPLHDRQEGKELNRMLSI